MVSLWQRRPLEWFIVHIPLRSAEALTKKERLSMFLERKIKERIETYHK